MTTTPDIGPTKVVDAPADRLSVLGASVPEALATCRGQAERILHAIREAVEQIIAAGAAHWQTQPETGGPNDH